MSKRLKLYITGVVTTSAVALVVTILVFPVDPLIDLAPDHLGQYAMVAGIVFWCFLTLVASALPVRMPRGTLVGVSGAPIIAAAFLGGPTAAGLVALIGTTEVRELRGRIPWYGTLANHAGLVIPAIVTGVVMHFLGDASAGQDMRGFISALIGGAAFFLINVCLTALLISLRTDQPFARVLVGDSRGFATSLVALAPLSWLMAQMYMVAWWASLLFALPLYTTRLAYHNFIEMREMFTQTITALAGAVDKRDPVHEQALLAGQGDRRRHRPGDAADRG